MGQKDLTQKNLEFYPDVFADIINALLYGGKPVLQPEKLSAAPTETLYNSLNKGVRNQFHDVSKYEIQDGRIKLQYTLENESGCNGKMILRKAGYEGAVYREQYDNKTKETYPVIGTVLHWGQGKWKEPKSIHTFFRKRKLSKETLHYINNTQLQVFDMRSLPPEVRQRFRSDMRIVVDYLAEGKDYAPTRQKLKHPEEVLQMLRNLTNDERYLTILNAMQEEEKKGGVAMCELLDKYWNDGVATGIEKGMRKGMQKGMRKGVRKGVRKGRIEERENGLAAMVNTLKPLLPDFQAVLESIRSNECYVNVTEEQVRKYY